MDVILELENSLKRKQLFTLVAIKNELTEIKDMEKIDPNSIQSVTVLKNQSAIEKVGKKGENGVVIITLKEGFKYDFND